MTDSKSCNSVTHNILLLTTYFTALTSTLCWIGYLESRLASLRINYEIIHRTNISISTVFFQKRLHVRKGIKVELCPLHGHLLENHIVLCQRSSLVGQEELNAAELFRDSRVARDCIRHVLISVDKV